MAWCFLQSHPENCKRHVRQGRYTIDLLVTVKDSRWAIEYDGPWHSERYEEDRQRDRKLLDVNIQTIRIRDRRLKPLSTSDCVMMQEDSLELRNALTSDWSPLLDAISSAMMLCGLTWSIETVDKAAVLQMWSRTLKKTPSRVVSLDHCLTELRLRSETGQSMSPKALRETDNALLRSCRSLFGSYKEALTRAGFDWLKAYEMPSKAHFRL